ncbi:MAG: ATP-grasp domain-containing protein [Promethearchaeota archaeon]
MDSLKNIFIFEYLSSGAISGKEHHFSLLSEGFGMLSALIKDFLALNFSVNIILDKKLEGEIKSVEQHAKINKYIEEKSNDKKIRNNIKLNYEIINCQDEFDKNFDKNIKKSQFIMIIAPEHNNILYNYVKRVENIIKNYRTIILLNPPSSFIHIFGDKTLTQSHCRDLFTVPDSFSFKGFLDFYKRRVKNNDLFSDSSDLEKHFIIKPNDGVGCIDTFEIKFNIMNFKETPENLIKHLKNLLNFIKENYPQKKYIIQQKVKGLSLSISAINRGGEMVFFSINKQLLQNTPVYGFGGKVEKIKLFKLDYLGGVTPYSSLSGDVLLFLKSITKRICEKYNFTGFFGIDFIYNPDRKLGLKLSNQITVIEINPRVTTPYVAYSEIFRRKFRRKSQNIAEFFFQNKFIQEQDDYGWICEYKKNITNSDLNSGKKYMDIQINPKK